MSDINTPRDSTLKTTEQTPRNIADVLAEELAGIAGAIGNVGTDDYDDLTHRPQINSVTLTGNKSADDLSLAMQGDLTSIKATGTTNATGATISKGTYFYLNGTLCQAKVDIASGATFTLNTNYEVVTAGGLNSLNSAIDTKANKPTSYSVGTVNIQASTYTTIDIPYTDIPTTSKCLTPYFASYPDSSLLSMTLRIIRTNNAWRIAVYNTATRAVSVGITVDYIPV